MAAAVVASVDADVDGSSKPWALADMVSPCYFPSFGCIEHPSPLSESSRRQQAAAAARKPHTPASAQPPDQAKIWDGPFPTVNALERKTGRTGFFGRYFLADVGSTRCVERCGGGMCTVSPRKLGRCTFTLPPSVPLSWPMTHFHMRPPSRGYPPSAPLS